jgi:hypothetical protein
MNGSNRLLLVFVFLALATMCHAQQPKPPTGGPYMHKIWSASSPDGLVWARDEGFRLEHASVPCAIALDDKIILYYVDADRGTGQQESTGCAISTDGIKFEKQKFAIQGMPSAKALDPSIWRDSDGKLRLYYFACERDPGAAGKHSVRLAYSEDGVNFKDECLAFSHESLVDPDVFFFKDTWFMYVFGRGNTVIATSKDGRTFSYMQELALKGWGTTAPVALDAGRLRLYAFDQTTRTGNTVCSFISENGIDWRKEDGIRLQGGEKEQITDPFVIRWKNGWKMYFKTEDRSGAAKGPQPGGTPGMPGKDQPGPWDNDVLVYRAGADGKVEKFATFERAGVPTVARMKDGRLIAAHQHFPENNAADFDKVAVRFSKDEGKTWTDPQVIKLEGLPEGMRFPFDPTLVPLPDGKIRLYFTSTKGRTFQTGAPEIYSAISNDGVSYKFEEGARFAIEGRFVIDCAVVLHNGVFHLYSPDNGEAGGAGPGPGGRPNEGVGYHAVSNDGLKFERKDDVKIDDRRSWLGNAQSDGKKITFYGTGEGFKRQEGRPGGGIWMATSEDGKTWTPVESPAVGGADPGTVTASDGALIFVVTGEPRPGTPSAKQRKPGVERR